VPVVLLLAWPFLIAPLLAAPLLAAPLFGGVAHAEPPPGHFDVVLAAEVFSTALAFMEPRTLDAIPLPQMVLWGLRGLTTLDPTLTAEARDGDLRLSAPDRILLTRPLPPPDDIRAWSEAAAAMAGVAWEVSPAVRSGGTAGIIHSFFDELFNHFDPYSRYVPPDEAADDRGRRSGTAGAGLQLALRGGAVWIDAVARDGPAGAAGVRAGERLLEIDGRRVERDAARAAAALQGPEGSTVELTLAARGGRTRRVTLVRALVPPETVFATVAQGMLVLRVSGFSDDTGSRLAHELLAGLQPEEAAETPSRSRAAAPAVHGVVFDLRGNRGGLLREAVTVAETVLSGAVVATTAGRDPAASHVLRAGGADLTNGLPVVIVVDGRTASAAEIVAAALADQRRGVVVGSSTLGKGLVQTIAPLPDGGELFVTWSRVLAPQGWPIQGLGVLPQLCTSLGQDYLQRQEAALTQGRELLAPALAQQRTARAPVSLSQILAIRDACPAAEGRDADLAAAQFLIDTPDAYAAALLPVTAAAH
jgi:carboxyl-terminal processing protease